MAVSISVTILTPEELIFSGELPSIVLPGEDGVFEVLPFHKRMLTRLVGGLISVGTKDFDIKRGIVKIEQNKVTIIVEERKAQYNE